MLTTAKEVFEGSLGLLNDLNQAIYREAKMLPLINQVYRELQTKLQAMGIRVSHEKSTEVVVTAGTSILTFGAGLPADLLRPVKLMERANGGSAKYADMYERSWPQDLTPTTALVYWTWQEEELHLPGATGDVQLWINYIKTLGRVTALDSPILIADSDVWMAQRVASMAALLIGNNPTRAAALDKDLKSQWSTMMATKTHGRQSLPARRKRTRYRSN